MHPVGHHPDNELATQAVCPTAKTLKDTRMRHPHDRRERLVFVNVLRRSRQRSRASVQKDLTPSTESRLNRIRVNRFPEPVRSGR
jgi:hypothetical protein